MKISRRTFFQALASMGAVLAAAPFTAMAHGLFPRSQFEYGRQMFAWAIASQQNGNSEQAAVYARECLSALHGLETAEETAAGSVVAVSGRIICEPSFLHTETARQRFRSEGIAV